MTITAAYDASTGIATWNITATNNCGLCLLLSSWAVTHKDGVLLGLTNQPSWMTAAGSGSLTAADTYVLTISFTVDVLEAFTSITDTGVYTVTFTVTRADCLSEAMSCTFPLSLSTILACDPETVTPPGEITLTATGAVESVDLAWTPAVVPGLAGYNVYRSAGLGGPFTQIASLSLGTFPDPDNPTYHDDNAGSGLTPGTEYCYYVFAYDNASVETVQSNTACATPEAAFPVTPANILILEGTNITTLSAGQTVETWPDSGPNEAHGIRQAGAPVYRTGGPGSQPYVEFEETGWIDAVLPITVNQPYVILAVMKDRWAGTTNTRRYWGRPTDTSDTSPQFVFVNPTVRMTAGSLLQGGSSLTFQNWCLAETYWDGANGKLVVDGSTVMSGNVGAGGFIGIRVNCQNGTTSLTPGRNDYAAIIALGSPSAQDIADWKAYLMNKYFPS